jgi:hypothetical protein
MPEANTSSDGVGRDDAPMTTRDKDGNLFALVAKGSVQHRDDPPETLYLLVQIHD